MIQQGLRVVLRNLRIHLKKKTFSFKVQRVFRKIRQFFFSNPFFYSVNFFSFMKTPYIFWYFFKFKFFLLYNASRFSLSPCYLFLYKFFFEKFFFFSRNRSKKFKKRFSEFFVEKLKYSLWFRKNLISIFNSKLIFTLFYRHLSFYNLFKKSILPFFKKFFRVKGKILKNF